MKKVLLRAIAKSSRQVGRVGKRSAAEEPNYRRRRLLRALLAAIRSRNQ
jgi:hypothetical protein